MELFERSRRGENALLIHPHRGGVDEDAEQEFAELARSAGAQVVASLGARIDRPSPATFIGSGKVEEAKMLADATGADLVLVDHALTPVQERNLEKALGRRVVDRTGLILDIFALRARSHEGKLQVELAQLRHLATRLVRGWTHLERQRGGSIGLRGPGETQLETDRRLLQKRVDMLQKRLGKVEVQQAQMRRARERNALPRVALVGYTNAGKSTLFNALTGASVYAEDQLFATLDPTVRRLRLPGAGTLVLSDTVGFVRDLPHELVAAFRSTLSEAREADLLLHLVDAADPLREERIAQVDAVLEEIGAGEIPQLLLFNKIDRIEGADARHEPEAPGGRERIWLSAQRGDGIDLLRETLDARFRLRRVGGELHLPPEAGRLHARLHAAGGVVAETLGEDGWRMRLDMPLTVAERIAAEPDAAPLRALLPPRDDVD
ncbi:ribosome rescue GTPase HflX [Coralloluteibacterium thermophilus]|uniref:GTPase HflX n=1 Tax=Coralloluteibacterium thermophilum TaxID=2707049 RepID=A0ABV9NPJ9_9GAMM